MAQTRQIRTYMFCCVAVIGLLCCISLYQHQPPGPEKYFHWTLMTKPKLLPLMMRAQLLIEPFQTQKLKYVSKRFGTELRNQHQIVSLYRNVCHAYDSDIQILQPKLQFKSLVLVITLNNPLYEILPLVELLYRPLFPEIVYCISNGDKSRELKDWNLNILYYKSPPEVRAGIYNYICVEYVHKLGLKADGFLFMSDDILVSPSAVANFSRQPLPASPLCGYKSSACKPQMTNPPAYCTKKSGTRHIQHATLALVSLRRELKLKPKDSVGPRCDRIIQNLTGVTEPLVHCLPDIFFIPSFSMEDASHLFRQFYKYKVYHAAAVYHVVLCLSSPASPNAWKFRDIHRDRKDFTKTAPHVVSGRTMVVHPVKLSPLLNRTTKYDKYFCKTLLPFLHNSK